MKIQITFKTPDAAERAVNDAVRSELLPEFLPDCLQDYIEIHSDEAKKVVDKFVKYGEYCTI